MRRLAADKYDPIDFQPPKSVADEAEKGLEYRAKANPSDKGGLTPAEASEQGIGSGVQRATNLKNRTNVSPEVIRQMCAFFARHEKNKGIAPENRDTPWKDKGHVAWLLWGGDSGKAWAEKVRGQMDRADEKADKTASTVTYKTAHQARPPRGFRENPSTSQLSCPHRDVTCCPACLKANPEIVEVGGQCFWTSSEREKKELLREMGKTAHGLIDHELVNDLASAYRGKKMRDGIRDMEMAGMPEQVAERFYNSLGEHADEVRGELHRVVEEHEGEGCGCGCGSDCPCMKDRVASKFVEAIGWSKRKELEWEARLELKHERDDRRKQELLRAQEERLKHEWAALSEAEKAEASEEMAAHNKKVQIWKEMVQEWDRRKKEIQEANEAKQRDLEARRLKALEDIGREMRQEGWKVEESTESSVTYAIELPSEKMDQKGNALTYRGHLTIYAPSQTFVEANKGWESRIKVFLAAEVRSNEYWRSSDGTITLRQSPDLLGGVFFRKNLYVATDTKLDDMVDRGQAMVLGAIEKHKRSMPDIPDVEYEKLDGREPGPAPQKPKTWGWQQKLEKRQREKAEAKRKAEEDKRKEEEEEAKFLLEVGKDFKREGWTAIPSRDPASPPDQVYVEAPYEARIEPSMRETYDWAYVDGWYVTVKKDGHTIFSHRFKESADAIMAAHGAIEKDRRNLERKKPEPAPAPPSAPATAPTGGRDDMLVKVQRLGEAAASAGNQWMTDFAKSIATQLAAGRSLSEKQLTVVEKGFRQFRIDDGKSEKPTEPAALPAESSNMLASKSFCFTGTMRHKREDLEALVVKNGGTVKSGVTKGLTYLVMADPNSKSSKAEAARKAGTQCISEEDFLKMVGTKLASGSAARVVNRFLRAAAKPVDMKKAVEKLAQAAEKAFKGAPGVGTTHVSLESKPGFEVGEVYINGGQYQIRIVGIVQEGNISIGANSGNHPLTSLGSRGPATDAAKRLKKPVEFLLGMLAEQAAKAAPVTPKGPSLDAVRGRLRSIRLGPGGSVHSVEELSPTEWSVEPRNRLRLDHYGNRGEGWDDEGWQRDYAGPMSAAAEKWLDTEFGKGLFGGDVDEKGYVFIFLTADGKKHYGV